MPRFRAKRDAFLPDGVHGPTIVYETDCITVSGDEAEILRADPDTWEDMDALTLAEAAEALKQVKVERNKMIAGSENKKASKGEDDDKDEDPAV